MDLTKIVKLLAQLSQSLHDTGNEAHVYVDSLIRTLRESDDADDVKDALRQVKSSAKMVDYAEFDNIQEQAWMNAWEEASDLLEGIPTGHGQSNSPLD